jgi:hypothetical protein
MTNPSVADAKLFAKLYRRQVEFLHEQNPNAVPAVANVPIPKASEYVGIRNLKMAKTSQDDSFGFHFAPGHFDLTVSNL